MCAEVLRTIQSSTFEFTGQYDWRKRNWDIAFVISRNTPLRTLNLSDNIVDAKSAVLLAQALGKNSHLKEIDLRNNRLGDAGIAIILEPFIL